MAAKKRSARSSSPLDAQQRALVEQQENLRKKMDRLKRMIDEAPKLQEQVEKRRREELMARSPRMRRLDASTLNDKRFDVATAGSLRLRPRRSLKSEQRQARLTFFGLFFGLLLLLVWLYSVWRW